MLPFQGGISYSGPPFSSIAQTQGATSKVLGRSCKRLLIERRRSRGVAKHPPHPQTPSLESHRSMR